MEMGKVYNLIHATRNNNLSAKGRECRKRAFAHAFKGLDLRGGGLFGRWQPNARPPPSSGRNFSNLRAVVSDCVELARLGIAVLIVNFDRA